MIRKKSVILFYCQILVARIKCYVMLCYVIGPLDALLDKLRKLFSYNSAIWDRHDIPESVELLHPALRERYLSILYSYRIILTIFASEYANILKCNSFNIRRKPSYRPNSEGF